VCNDAQHERRAQQKKKTTQDGIHVLVSFTLLGKKFLLSFASAEIICLAPTTASKTFFYYYSFPFLKVNKTSTMMTETERGRQRAREREDERKL
jgi:hypothetical protein